MERKKRKQRACAENGAQKLAPEREELALIQQGQQVGRVHELEADTRVVVFENADVVVPQGML